MSTPTSSSTKMPAIVQQKPAVSSWVIFKLLAFTAALITLPIGTYFYTVERLFEGNGTYAAGAAAVMANLVAISYVIAAALEDRTEKKKEE